MRVHLVNPSDLSFGTAVITPRWLFVLAAATPPEYGTPVIVDETVDQLEMSTIGPGDVVGIGIHTGNALRGYELGRQARALGAWVVFGGVHPSLYPEEAKERGQAHAIVKGDGDVVWRQVLADCVAGHPEPFYDGGRIEGAAFAPARWDLMPVDKYMWGSVQTLRGCPKHCSFCSVWRTDGQKPRQRVVDDVIEELVALRRRGIRFIALADDNFYPVTLEDLAMAARRKDDSHLRELQTIRNERFELMARMEDLPDDMVFYTQVTMEVAEDPEYLKAMRRAHIRGALVGVESVTEEGLKAVYKGFNESGENLVERLRAFREHDVHVLGSFIFGLPTDKPDTFMATADLAARAGVSFAQFVMMQPLPGTVDFGKWEKEPSAAVEVKGVPISRYWLIPSAERPRVYTPHPRLSPDEIRQGTQLAWDHFYRLGTVWKRSDFLKSYKSRIAFVLISKLYRQMYANTGIATDSARVSKSQGKARFLAKMARKMFVAAPMPDLQVPRRPRMRQTA